MCVMDVYYICIGAVLVMIGVRIFYHTVDCYMYIVMSYEFCFLLFLFLSQ